MEAVQPDGLPQMTSGNPFDYIAVIKLISSYQRRAALTVWYVTVTEDQY